MADGGEVIAVGESQGGQGFHGDCGFRLQFGQHLGIAADGVVVLLLQEQGHQVGERLLAAGIAGEHAAIILHRFGVAAGLVEDDGLAEQRLLVIGELLEVVLDGRQRFGDAAGVEERDAEAEQSVGAGGIEGDGAGEAIDRLFPAFQMAVADAQVEVGGTVGGIGFGQLRVGGGGGFEVAHFILDVAECGEQAGLALTVFDSLGEEVGGGIELAFQVERDGLGERAANALLLFELGDRGNAWGEGNRQRIAAVFHCAHQIHGVVLRCITVWARGARTRAPRIGARRAAAHRRSVRTRRRNLRKDRRRSGRANPGCGRSSSSRGGRARRVR